MEYKFNEIEKKWQDYWKENKLYEVENDFTKPKYYVLDMFPYPSGAGLHVGHPLGYIASDIYSRYKRLKGFNVLHPMGFDSFGLPAEQYAIETGQHPAQTTQKNIETFKAQLDKIGFCYDWEREVQTSNPSYYKWTQWIFLQLYNSYFCNTQKKALPISELVKKYETKGSSKFSAEQWNNFSVAEKEEWLMQRRLAFSKFGEVNWCEALGTVLANDEVVNGVSERGGHPVVKKKMRQWYLRITAYADRLLEGLERVDFSDSMKEMQRNWIGRSEGAEINFEIKSQQSKTKSFTVYTTRPDTIFGVDFMVVAPELDWIADVVSTEQKQAVEDYINYCKSRSDRERQAEVKQVTGCFTGAFAINPFNGREIPIYIAEYVLAGYGTGAIMAVPCGDERDFKFAKHFEKEGIITITNIIGDAFNGSEANPTKDAILQNSDFLNGLVMKDAMKVANDKIEEMGIGKRKVNYKMRDAGFSRQRYWGEPFPITWKDGIAKPWQGNLPLQLPHVQTYTPGPDGASPLANIPEWIAQELETNTMPGYAGSSWYFLRYMDPHNDKEFCNRKISDYWNQVDLYIGGTEHAVGHLLYSRMWTKVLYDLGFIGFDEPFKRLLNQGMITGKGYFLKFVKLPSTSNVSSGEVFIISNNRIKESFEEFNYSPNFIESDNTLRLKYGHSYIDTENKISEEQLKKYYDDNTSNERSYEVKWEMENGKKFIIVNETIEKMSKSKYNTVNPDEICNKYGADTFRMYEMFLGPVEASKPWDTKGIEGVHRFLKKLWRLFNDEIKGKIWVDEKPTNIELKILHQTIKKVEEDNEKFSFNTAVSAFMICINELYDIKCHKKEILQNVLILLAPYAPHITEELWHQLGNTETILNASYPKFNSALLIESTKEYPISINGKVRANISLALDLSQQQVEEIILQNEIVKKWIDGKAPKKIIYVKNKMINVVV